MLDVTQALKDTENALRDLIAEVLIKKFGNDQWIEKCGVTPERLEEWKRRQADEERRQEAGAVDERLLYYADFRDLETILRKNWQDFSAIFGDWKTMEVYLSELGKMRDPEAHRRELLPHQKNLVVGIAGEIRTRMIKHRSKEETGEDYYPRIESARDSLGNVYAPGSLVARSKITLRPGDKIEYVATASDPLGEGLEYRIHSYGVRANFRSTKWQSANTFTLEVRLEDVGKFFEVDIYIRSGREFHASGDHDDSAKFVYEVLPPKTSRK